VDPHHERDRATYGLYKTYWFWASAWSMMALCIGLGDDQYQGATFWEEWHTHLAEETSEFLARWPGELIRTGRALTCYYCKIHLGSSIANLMFDGFEWSEVLMCNLRMIGVAIAIKIWRHGIICRKPWPMRRCLQRSHAQRLVSQN
jgi:hypothetical protein